MNSRFFGFSSGRPVVFLEIGDYDGQKNGFYLAEMPARQALERFVVSKHAIEKQQKIKQTRYFLLTLKSNYNFFRLSILSLGLFSALITLAKFTISPKDFSMNGFAPFTFLFNFESANIAINSASAVISHDNLSYIKIGNVLS